MTANTHSVPLDVCFFLKISKNFCKTYCNLRESVI